MSANKQDNKFEDLGSLKDFCSKYGTYNIVIENDIASNIYLLIKSEQEIELRIFCSIALSEIIRDEGELPKNIDDYHVLRIKRNDDTSYLRVSQNLNIEGDPNLSPMENVEKIKNLRGNVAISLKINGWKSRKGNNK